MKIEPEILKYLKGEAFSSSITVEFERICHEVLSREAVITGIIEGKNVIHLGCSDHIPIIQEKIRNNTWLHKLITDNAKRCIGIDIDRESIDFLKNELGYQNVYYGDVLKKNINTITERKWDYVVFGEIIEHLDNPVNFLQIFKNRYGDFISKFIITVPNIYNRNQFRNMMKFKEIINSDHRFWFTPYTISKILVSAGFRPEKVIYSNLSRLNFFELAIRKIKRLLGIQVRYPFYYFNSIIVTGDIT